MAASNEIDDYDYDESYSDVYDDYSHGLTTTVVSLLSNTTSSAVYSDSAAWVHQLVYILAFPIMILSIILNLPVIVAIFTMKKRRPFYLLIANLAIADFLVGLTLLFQALPAPSSKYQCLLVMSLIVVSWVCSFFGALFIATDRLLIVIKPLKHRALVTKKKVGKLLILTWMVSALWSFIIFIPGVNNFDRIQQCHALVFPIWYISATAIWYVIAVAGTCGLYAKLFNIYRNERHSAHKLQRSVSQVEEKRNNMKLASALLLVTCVFIFCWTPHVVCILLLSVGYYFNPEKFTQLTVWNIMMAAYNFTFMFAMLNSAINPLLYAWKIQAIRDECLSMLPNRLTKLLPSYSLRRDANKDYGTMMMGLTQTNTSATASTSL